MGDNFVDSFFASVDPPEVHAVCIVVTGAISIRRNAERTENQLQTSAGSVERDRRRLATAVDG